MLSFLLLYHLNREVEEDMAQAFSEAKDYNSTYLPTVTEVALASLGVPILLLFIFSIHTITKCKLLKMQFKIYLLNNTTALMLHWATAIMLFIWYPGLIYPEHTGPFKSRFDEGLADDNNLCSGLLAVYEVATVQALATVGLYAIVIFLSLQFPRTDFTSYVMVTIAINWAMFVLNAVLLATNNFGYTNEHGYCAADSDAPFFWASQGIVIAQFVAWFTVTPVTSCLVVRYFRKKNMQERQELKIVIKLLLVLSVVGMSVVVIFLTPGFSPFVAWPLPNQQPATVVTIHQVLPILALAPTLVVPILTTTLLKWNELDRSSRFSCVKVMQHFCNF